LGWARPPVKVEDEVWSTDDEGAGGLSRMSLAAGLPRTPVVGGLVGQLGINRLHVRFTAGQEL